MQCERADSLTKKAGHRPKVIIAALGTLLTATAVCQNQPNAPANSQAEKPATTPKNQTKPPAAAPGAEAKQPATPAAPAPKPSLMDKVLSPFKKKNQSDTGESQSGSFWDRFRKHQDNPEKTNPPQQDAKTGTGKGPIPKPIPPPQVGRPGGGTGNGPAPLRPLPNPPEHPQRPNPPAPGPATRPAVPPIHETPLPSGNIARTAPDGSLRELHSPKNNMSIHYGMSGSRRIRVDQPDGRRIVLGSRGVPYVQKPWNFRGQAFDHRTYVDNGVLRDQFYRQYAFGGSTLDVYAPQRFYSQDFYKWAAKPQSWTPRPWSDQMKQQLFTPYQAYFTPQSSYPSPVLWLTDFVLAMSLFEAHNAHPLPAQAPPSVPGASTSQSAAPQTPSASAPVLQAPIAPTPTSPAAVPPPTPVPPVLQPPVVPTKPDDQGPSLGIWERFTNYIRGLFGQTPAETAPLPPEPPPLASGAAPITDDVKDKVTDEVRAQIAQEAREADASARNLEPKPGAGSVVEELATRAQHVFVVASDLDLVDDTGRRCMMSEGDVVQILSAADAASGTAPGVVLSSKGGVECTQSAKVDITVDDLQEMQNHMRATIDEGLANTPRGGIENPVKPAFAGVAPPADADAKNEIEKQKTIAASLESGS